MKALNALAAGAAVFTAIGIAVLAYVAATFDARDYAPHIVRYVHEHTGRTLHIDGALRLSFWPDLGIDLDRAWLSERETDEHFADVERAHIAARLLPLLSRELVAREIRLQGARVAITRGVDGRLNIDDLLQSAGAPLQFDIGRIAIERSSVAYRDALSGKRYDILALDLETGRISNEAETALKAAFTTRDAAQSFEVATLLKSRLWLDVAQQRYRLTNALLELSGHVPGIDRFSAKIGGDLRADLKQRELDGVRVAADVSASIRGEKIELDAQAAQVLASAGRATAIAVNLSLHATGPAGKTQVKLAVPKIERADDAVKTDSAALDVVLDRGGVHVAVSAATPLQASLAARSITLAQLESTFHATGSPLPRGGVKGTLAGTGQIDVAHEGVHLKLAGKVDGSRVDAQVGSSGFASPVYAFALDIDELDAERYAGGGVQSPGGNAHGLAALEGLPASGTIRVGVLRSGGITAKNVKLALK